MREAARGHVDRRADAVSASEVEVLRRVYPSLLRIAACLVAWDEREDLVQDALVATLRVHRGLEEIVEPIGYVRTVMVRLVGGTVIVLLPNTAACRL
jgi:DNA-directed RNA polymerase specialized sigma24 family protein